MSLSTAKLYLADDHLLLVQNSAFSLKVSRFYYRDIQAITVRRAADHVGWRVLLGSVLLIMFIVMLAAYHWVLLLIVLLLGLWLTAEIISGPSCRCAIQTAMTLQPISCLSRIPRAQQFITIMQPLLERSQSSATTPGAVAEDGR